MLVGEHQLPVQRACRTVRLSRAAYYRPPIPASRRDAAVIAALTDVVARYPRWGFWKLFDRMRTEGRPWNHKHVHRVYCALRLNLPRRTTRRVPHRVRQPLAAAPHREPREDAQKCRTCWGLVALLGPSERPPGN